MQEIIKFSDVEKAIVDIRDTKVIPDFLVARLYGVETKRINEAVRNNPEKFPDGYLFELTSEEKTELVENFDQFNIKHSYAKVKAFTEKGLYMLATILKSPVATQTTIAIVETFAKFRELTRTLSRMSTTTDKMQQKSLMEKSAEIFSDLLDDSMQVTDTETTLELNLAVLKVKHTVKRNKKT